ncbi:MAG TPA: hypothetical protein VHS09_03145 [Polyangiaceae bacterium]|nr:hypothetical protein [Polyangiaceae bacterium]
MLAFVGLLLALVGCQLVAGITTRKVDPINPGCVLPSASGGPLVRVANLVPTSDLVDVCIRTAGSADWGRPILLDGGTDCADAGELGAAGFAYGNVSVTFTAPSATVDVKMIAGGSTCGAGALGEGDGLTLATNAVTTLALLGGNGVGETVVAMPEADSLATSGQRFRVVHAAPGTGALDMGIAATAALPTTLTSEIFSAPIPYGGPIPAGTTSDFAIATLQDDGYLQLFTGAFIVGASLDGDASKKAVFVYQFLSGTATYSMYVIGIPGNDQYPLRALVCQEDVKPDGTPTNPGKTPFTINCVQSPLSTLSVDIFNTGLYGPNSPDFALREGVIPTAIAARDADVMCVVEVDEDLDKNNILQKATSTMGGTGPYANVYLPTANVSTPFTNPKDQNGNVPPPPTAPPCSGVDQATVDAAIQCAEQNCSTTAGDPNGKLLGSSDCLVDNCAAPFLDVQSAGVACYDCLVVYTVSDTSWSTSENNCTTDTRPPLGFSGAQNSMILSKYPLLNTDTLVLPSTDYRRTVLYAQVQLEDQTVDFYCGFLTTTLNADALPYVGSYGNGATDSLTAWQNEQAYQAQQLVAYVQQKSGASNPPNPAVVVGDWRSSQPAATGAMGPPGTSLPNALSNQTMDFFQKQSGWIFAVDQSTGTSWGPQCNFCPASENPYNLTDSYFVVQPMLVDWPGDVTHATTSEQLLYTTGVVNLGGDGGLGPPSPYYGLNFRVLRPR